MKFKITKKIIIANAIFWALGILIGSYFFRHTDSWSIMFIFMIGGYTIVNGFLADRRRKEQGLKPKC